MQEQIKTLERNLAAMVVMSTVKQMGNNQNKNKAFEKFPPKTSPLVVQKQKSKGEGIIDEEGFITPSVSLEKQTLNF